VFSANGGVRRTRSHQDLDAHAPLCRARIQAAQAGAGVPFISLSRFATNDDTCGFHAAFANSQANASRRAARDQARGVPRRRMAHSRTLRNARHPSSKMVA
jgi:hypothetical protein